MFILRPKFPLCEPLPLHDIPVLSQLLICKLLHELIPIIYCRLFWVMFANFSNFVFDY